VLRLAQKAICLSLALVLALAPIARADLVHLNTGGVVKGEIVSETPEEVKIKTASGGVTTIFREDIERIERNTKADFGFKEKFAKVDAKDADGYYKLGREMQKLRLDKEAAQCFEKAIKIDANHVPAKIALAEGKARTNELAVVAETASDAAPEKETPAASGSALLPRGKINPAILKAYEDAKKALKDADPKKQEAGFAQAVALYEDPLASDVHAAILGAVIDLGKRERQGYERTAKRLSQAISEYEKADQKKARDRYLAAWIKAKDEALEVIFDLKIYPDENHGKVGQPKVDEKVDVVKKVYPIYEQLVMADIAKFNGLQEEQAKKIVAALEGAKARMALVSDALARCLEVAHVSTDEHAPQPPAIEAPAPLEEPLPIAWAMLLYKAGRIDDAYDMHERLTPWEVRLMERMRDLRVEGYNDKVWKDAAPPEKGKRPNDPERKQVEITNKYRIMMGKPAIEIHTCLVESARGHSAEMTQLNYFEHDSPVEKNRTPSDRARNAGYDSGAAENISLGSEAPQATHDAWYNSSGHHRNILGNHTAMGSGLDGRHWTQNFGSVGLLRR